MKGHHWKGLLAAFAGTTALCSAAPAAAQTSADAAAASAGLEEILVTSRKREERLQDVPDSIFVLSSLQLEMSNVESLRDFVDLTPNLLVRETFRSNETFLTMRGLSSAQGALPPVAFVVDGVQLGSNDFINQDLLDIERIEVLRGPQGALYGQGAIAGAINVVTRQPTNEFEGFVKASYGNGDSKRIAGALSAPIVEDRLFARISGYYKDSDGLIKNNRGEDIDFLEEGSIRGRILYRSDVLDIDLRGSYTKGDGSCCIQDRVNLDDNGNLIGVDDVTNPGASSNIIGTSDDKLFNTSLKVDVDLGFATVTSITGYAEIRQAVFGDADMTIDPVTAQDLSFDTDVFNQELRVSSNSDGRFRWLFGGFYQDRQERQHIRIGADTGERFVANPSILHQRNITNSELWAAFGQVSFDLTDRIELTAALRYDHDDQDSRNIVVSEARARATFKEWQPKAQIAYRWTDDVMVYASFARGFRPGGFTSTVVFENETTDNYEVGFKTTFLDNRLSINGAFFHIDYSNQQLSFVVFTETEALRGAANIPATDIDGMELEIAARPIDNLTITAGLGVTDTVISTVAPSEFFGPDIVQLIGKKSPLVPPFTFNASVTYAHPVADGLDLVFHSDFRRLGGYYFDAANTIYTRTKNFIGGKIALQADNWSVGVWAKNLTDARVATNVSATGARLRVPNPPRSYGVEATFNF
ncbi:MAG TPA: TonB-dependent receptor [Sphingomonadales bacterium]